MSKFSKDLARHIAEKCLKFKIDFNDDGKVYMEMAGSRWEFKKETDAEAVEEISHIFNEVNTSMWSLINEKVMSWAAKNKQSFN